MAVSNSHPDHQTKGQGIGDRLAGIPAGRRSRWIVLGVWFVLLVVVAPLAGRLQSVEENDAAAFLPEGAESLEVALIEEQFQRGDKSPAVIVYYRNGGLTEADLAVVEANRAAIDGEFSEESASPVSVSEDGNAALFSIPVEGETVVEDIALIRDTVQGGEGLEVKVTGPAGYLTDLVAVFDGIDITLILATASVVTILLLLIYRSPFLWLVPLVAVAVANFVATALVYILAREGLLAVNGQSGGILPILVFGVGTDYALLLIARYREELRHHVDQYQAMAIALRRAGPAILASAGTVIVGLLGLLASDLNSNQSLGIVGSLGILAALASMTMVLPALLVVLGRRVFWPFVPNAGDEDREGAGFWSRLGGWIGGRARLVWVGTIIVLGVLAIGVVNLDTNLAPEDQFRTTPEAIEGQNLISQSFAAGASTPSTVIANSSEASDVESAIAGTPGVANVAISGELDGLTSFSVTLVAEPGTGAAFEVIDDLRDRVHAVPDAGAIVGGPDAESLDIASSNDRDLRIVIPIVLVAVTIILGLLLRAIVAPLVLIATVVLSFGATLGASIIVFDVIFGYAAIERTVPILSFVFLVALGIDYNIFLVSRIHEEAASVGTEEGTRRGLATTGGVITSAGVVLAATFSVLSIFPLVSLAELGFVVAFGVLLDTLVVRSILVPALTFDVGRRMWWPSKLSRQGRVDKDVKTGDLSEPSPARPV